MPKLYSYVVDHDEGWAPHASSDLCSLARCKFGKGGKRNLSEMVRVGDWVAGTGGSNLKKSAGHGKLIAMRVDEILPLGEYFHGYPYRHDTKAIDGEVTDERFALLSRHFYYFGRKAVDLSTMPRSLQQRPFEKTGPGYRKDFSPEYVKHFAEWLDETFDVGVLGNPCCPGANDSHTGKHKRSPKAAGISRFFCAAG